MPATMERATAGKVTVQVNPGGPHAPEDFPSELNAERVAELLDEFGYEGTFTIFPGNLHKGGGRSRQFGKMFVHGNNNSEGINCSANFEERSDRHFAFALALPGLEARKTLLELKGHLERKYSLDGEDQDAANSDDEVDQPESVAMVPEAKVDELIDPDELALAVALVKRAKHMAEEEYPTLKRELGDRNSKIEAWNEEERRLYARLEELERDRAEQVRLRDDQQLRFDEIEPVVETLNKLLRQE